MAPQAAKGEPLSVQAGLRAATAGMAAAVGSAAKGSCWASVGSVSVHQLQPTYICSSSPLCAPLWPGASPQAAP